MIGSTGDLLDRLDGAGRRHLHRLGRHRGQAARASEHRAPVDPVQRRGRFAQLRDPGARRVARRRGVRPLRQGGGARDDGQGGPEVHRDPPRHRAAPASRRGGRRSCARGWPRRWSATRRARTCAWARWRRTRSSADVAERVADADAGRRAGLRRARRLRAAGRRRRRRRVLRADPAAGARPARRTTPCTTSRPSARSAR